jgi:hypothetical protein
MLSCILFFFRFHCDVCCNAWLGFMLDLDRWLGFWDVNERSHEMNPQEIV